MSIPYEKQLSSQTKELFESLISYFNEKKIKLFSYPTKTLHVFCEENGAKTKKEVMRKLALLYPELATYYQKEKRNKNKYFIKLFEAVGVATLHVQQLNRK